MMNSETVFSLANTLAAVAWLLLLVAPGWRWTERLVLNGAVSLGLAVLYTFLVVTFFSGAEGGFQSLAAVGTLFGQDWMLLAGWVHYLAFDLLIGVWIVRQARQSGIPHWLLVLPLFLTFMLGPMGWLSYQILRLVHSRANSFADRSSQAG